MVDNDKANFPILEAQLPVAELILAMVDSVTLRGLAMLPMREASTFLPYESE
jgi:hypothetical protein